MSEGLIFAAALELLRITEGLNISSKPDDNTSFLYNNLSIVYSPTLSLSLSVALEAVARGWAWRRSWAVTSAGAVQSGVVLKRQLFLAAQSDSVGHSLAPQPSAAP